MPAYDRAALRQELQSPEPSRAVPHHPRGGVNAGDKRCCGEHRLPCDGREDHLGAAPRRDAPAVHRPLEPEALRGGI